MSLTNVAELVLAREGLAEKSRLPANVKDFGAIGNGVVDDTVAIQAAVNSLAGVGGRLYFPSGTFKVNGTITHANIGWLTIEGSGIGSTTIQQYADAPLFSFNLTGGSLTVRDLFLQFVGSTTLTATAIRCIGDAVSPGHLPACIVHDVMMYHGGGKEWKYGVHVTDGGENDFNNVLMFGLGGMIGYRVDCSVSNTAAVGPHTWFSCSLYSGNIGIELVNTTLAGVEGAQITNCDWVGVNYGIYANSTYAPAYFPPHLAIIGGHINASNRCVYANRWSQIMIEGCLLYTATADFFIEFSDVSAFNISGNHFQTNGGRQTESS